MAVLALQHLPCIVTHRVIIFKPAISAETPFAVRIFTPKDALYLVSCRFIIFIYRLQIEFSGILMARRAYLTLFKLRGVGCLHIFIDNIIKWSKRDFACGGRFEQGVWAQEIYLIIYPRFSPIFFFCAYFMHL